MVDYSKWDHFGSDIESSEDEDERRPRVTKFDEPMSVSLRDGASAPSSLPPPRAAAAAASAAAAAASASSSTGASAATPRPSLELTLSVLTERGGRTSRSLWSQTADECIVSVPVPLGTRSSALRVTLVATSRGPEARHHARIELNGAVLIDAQLAFPIELEGGAPEADAEGEGGASGGGGDSSSSIDWELVDCGTPREELLEEEGG